MNGDIVRRLRQTRADMIGTEDEQHYWDCHDAAAEIERLRNQIEAMRAMGDGNSQDAAEPSGASAGYAREWRVAERWCDTLGEYRYCLIHPHGFVDSSFERSPLGRSEAIGWADTYNMNADRAAEFRECPYCKDGCPWCA